jgi:hypothetical protein
VRAAAVEGQDDGRGHDRGGARAAAPAVPAARARGERAARGFAPGGGGARAGAAASRRHRAARPACALPAPTPPPPPPPLSLDTLLHPSPSPSSRPPAWPKTPRRAPPFPKSRCASRRWLRRRPRCRRTSTPRRRWSFQTPPGRSPWRDAAPADRAAGASLWRGARAARTPLILPPFYPYKTDKNSASNAAPARAPRRAAPRRRRRRLPCGAARARERGPSARTWPQLRLHPGGPHTRVEATTLALLFLFPPPFAARVPGSAARRGRLARAQAPRARPTAWQPARAPPRLHTLQARATHVLAREPHQGAPPARPWPQRTPPMMI